LVAVSSHIERRLLALAGVFVLLQGLVLSLSPAVRARSWDTSLRFSHWIGILVWLIVVPAIQRLAERRLPGRDPFLVPVWALLSGWGILTIWRLDPGFGLRQAIWLSVSAGAAAALVWLWRDLGVLRRYKYVLLAGGLILMSLTIFLGTSPTGIGPQLWLGCCGLYFQPSEPLKLLLVVYLAAYLADRVAPSTRAFPLLLPTMLVGGLALLLLLAQRDLGSASILILLYAVVVYVATAKRRVMLAAAALLALAALAGVFFVDIVHARLEGWLNPWDDPSGRSYQIIQSLLSVANGGLIGRGLGLGSPGLVPVAHSDFAYSASAEEAGLVGSLGMLILYALLLSRGLLIALRAAKRFHRLLATGVTAYLGIQALLVIGGDLRMLPLTGVTLPFVSYGGSSLLTSTIAAALLMTVRNSSGEMPARLTDPRPYHVVAGLLATGFAIATVTHSWWAIVRGPDLLSRTDNARRSIADRYVRGTYGRVYEYPAFAAISGYTHPAYGQAGLESTLDDYLRGLRGNPASLIVWHQLLYGTPPPGLSVRLSIDLGLQSLADEALQDTKGAAVLIQAQSGEILAMASHPAYDPNLLDSSGERLAQDADAPLLNRAAQGMYAVGNAVLPFRVASGAASSETATATFRSLGFYTAPDARLPTATPIEGGTGADLRVSPLQMAIAAATLANEGYRPSARIAMAVQIPKQGWVVLPPLGTPQQVFSSEVAEKTASRFAVPSRTMWEWTSSTTSSGQPLTWYIGGTLSGWQGAPLAIAVVIERHDLESAQTVGAGLLESAISP
jgi:cell division protein FtsW (lipid II flippase)